MILKFDFQRDEVSFFFLLSHPTALPCIATIHDALHIWAVHQLLQDAELLFGGRRHQILPLLRQDGQVPVKVPYPVVCVSSAPGRFSVLSSRQPYPARLL